MTPDRWISVVSICLTFCLAFLTLVLIVLTLKEMKKQRKTMYIPDLVFGKNDFYLYWNKSTNTADIWSPIKLKESDLKKKSNEELRGEYYGRGIDIGLPLKLYNIGMGIAKTITVKWECGMSDISDWIKKIKELDTDNKYECSAMQAGDQDIFLYVSYQQIKYDYSTSTLTCSIDYILPAHIENQPYELKMPMFYLLPISLLYTLSCFEEGKLICKTPSFPEFKLTLSYLDVGNNEYKKEFSIKIDTYFYYPGKNGAPDPAGIGGRIEVKEVKKR